MSSAKCSNCCGEFRKRDKGGFFKHRMRNVATPETTKLLFPSVNVDEDYICESCRSRVRAICVVKRTRAKKKREICQLSQSAKKKWSTGQFTPSGLTPVIKKSKMHAVTPSRSKQKQNAGQVMLESPEDVEEEAGNDETCKTPPPLSPTPPSPDEPLLTIRRRPSHKRDAMKCLRQSHYEDTLEYLWCLEGGRKALTQFIKSKLKNEFRSVGSTTRLSTLMKPVTLKNIKEFRWSKVIKKMKSLMPFTTLVLKGMLPSVTSLQRKKRKGTRKTWRKLNKSEAQDMWNVKAGNILAMLLYARRPQIYNFWQSILGIEMWRQGASHRLIEILQVLGLCQTVGTVRSKVNEIRDLCNKERASSKTDTAEQLVGAEEYDENTASYSLCMDNIQGEGKRQHQSKDEDSKFVLGSRCFWVKPKIWSKYHIPSRSPSRSRSRSCSRSCSCSRSRSRSISPPPEDVEEQDNRSSKKRKEPKKPSDKEKHRDHKEGAAKHKRTPSPRSRLRSPKAKKDRARSPGRERGGAAASRHRSSPSPRASRGDPATQQLEEAKTNDRRSQSRERHRLSPQRPSPTGPSPRRHQRTRCPSPRGSGSIGRTRRSRSPLRRHRSHSRSCTKAQSRFRSHDREKPSRWSSSRSSSRSRASWSRSRSRSSSRSHSTVAEAIPVPVGDHEWVLQSFYQML